MASNKPPFRIRIAQKIAGQRAKEFIPALNPFDGTGFGDTGRTNNYTTKIDQMRANIGWCYAANTAIVDPTAAVPIKLYRKMKDGEREEIHKHPLLNLMDNPNLAHTGEQLRQLHFTYMNFVGESYIHMLARGGDPFIPAKGQLPDAMQIFPAHKVQFKLGETYTKSIVKLGDNEYPMQSFIRDLNPDPDSLYSGRSIIAASAVTIDTDNQMKEWNRGVFRKGARPGLVFTTNEELSTESYNRLIEQFNDEHAGTMNSYKSLVVENGDVKPFMMTQQDLDFLASRQFSRDEILAMWRVSPGIIGSVENVNRSNLEAGFYINAVINVVPRIRQFVRQLNATLVSVYDPTLELDFENPVPEDMQAKLEEAVAGVDKWRTKDETRAMFGDEPLPDGLGEHIIIVGKGAVTLEDVVNGKPAETTGDDETADNPAATITPDDELPEDDSSSKSLGGVKKKI